MTRYLSDLTFKAGKILKFQNNAPANIWYLTELNRDVLNVQLAKIIWPKIAKTALSVLVYQKVMFFFLPNKGIFWWWNQTAASVAWGTHAIKMHKMQYVDTSLNIDLACYAEVQVRERETATSAAKLLKKLLTVPAQPLHL